MSLPGIRDFVPYAEPPEAGGEEFDAWEKFGGKTLDEACDLFDPMFDGEDFMWMGGPAFKFYFTVIDRYLRSLLPPQEFCTGAWFLSACIKMHFDCHEDMSGLHEQIISLCDYVCAHPTHFDDEPEQQQEISVRWAELREQVADDARGIRRPRI